MRNVNTILHSEVKQRFAPLVIHILHLNQQNINGIDMTQLFSNTRMNHKIFKPNNPS